MIGIDENLHPPLYARPFFILSCLAVGIAAPVLLAWFMYSLIHGSEMQLSEVGRTQMLDFVRIKRSETVERKDRKPEKPQINQTPDAPPQPAQSNTAGNDILTVSAPTPVTTDLNLGAGGMGMGTADGEYMPIVKVAPIYPRSALVRKLTGQCAVSYTVTTTGTVTGVSVMENYCTDSIFHRPSVDAAKRFKYKPRIIDGVAVEVRGVQNVFYFDIEQENGEPRT